MAKDKLQTLADQLEEVMHLQEPLKAELKELEEKEDAIRAELLKGLVSKGFQFIRCTSGMSFGVVKGRVTFAIKKAPGMRQDAIKWAQENFPSILSISAADLNKVAAPLLELPDFLERKQSADHLAVRTSEDEAITKL